MNDLEATVNHLTFIENIISRLGQNSFLVKGWCVTLVSAIYALSAKDTNTSYAVVSYLPILSFWLLDGFLIASERRYRLLYNAVAARAGGKTDFSLDASSYRSNGTSWTRGVFSQTLVVFYPFMACVALLVMFTLPHSN